MEVQNDRTRYDSACLSLPPALQAMLQPVPAPAKREAFEIRLRVGWPPALTCPDRTWFVGEGGSLHRTPQGRCVTRADLAEAVVTMCAHSVHTHQHEIANGFIALRGGHRAGVCGSAVLAEGRVAAVRDVTSVNLRIAREVPGAADALVEQVFRNRLCGVLLAGPPSSGKTTLLRDLARQLAEGAAGAHRRVAVVDERGELGAVFEGEPQNNLGPCDILSGYPKGEGILMAVRTLSPQVILCDEIGAGSEVDGILEGIGCGVRMVATVHAGSIGELLRRSQVRRLLEAGAFERVVLLAGGRRPGRIQDILEVGAHSDAPADTPHRSLLLDDGRIHGIRVVRATEQAEPVPQP